MMVTLRLCFFQHPKAKRTVVGIQIGDTSGMLGPLAAAQYGGALAALAVRSSRISREQGYRLGDRVGFWRALWAFLRGYFAMIGEPGVRTVEDENA